MTPIPFLESVDLTTGCLFSGYGGLSMALNAYFGSRTAFFVDNDESASRILAHHWPDVPNLGDITAIDWSEVEPVDILCGGFPCQDVSTAGRRAGMRKGTRSGLWSYFAEAIHQLRPRYVVIENVRGLLSTPAHRPVESESDGMGDGGIQPPLRALGAVLGDLADLGYDAQWTTLAAASVGACHKRERVFIVATPARRAAATGSSHSRSEGAAVGRLLPTLRAMDGHGSMIAPAPRQHVADGNGSLPEVLGSHLLPTPRATDGTKGGPNQRSSSGDLMLPSAVTQLLPTPNASDGSGGGQHPDKREGHSRQLIDYALTVATAWGDCEPAIRRAEVACGRPAPSPTEPNRDGIPRLSPRFAEWMMMLPPGHVTGVGLSRSRELRALGSGVVPAQVHAALAQLVPVAESLVS